VEGSDCGSLPSFFFGGSRALSREQDHESIPDKAGARAGNRDLDLSEGGLCGYLQVSPG
jgi:hypothetical protein